jgi:hypothetical protein
MAIEGRMMPAGICRPNVKAASNTPRRAEIRSRVMTPVLAFPDLQRPSVFCKVGAFSEENVD